MSSSSDAGRSFSCPRSGTGRAGWWPRKSSASRRSSSDSRSSQPRPAAYAKTDQDRRQFVSRYFHHDMSDPHLYDLVLNVERLGPAATAEQIVAACAASRFKTGSALA